MCKCVIILGIFAVLGIAVLILGFILGFVVFENIIDDGIIAAVRLEKNTPQFERFIEMPFPHTFRVYFYNVTNAADVLAGAIPNVEEVGPYVYSQYRVRENVIYNENNDELTYTQRRNFEFNVEASGNLHENDSITVLNVPLQSLFQIQEGGNNVQIINDAWSVTFGENSIFHTVTVSQYLFSGYQFCNPVAPPPQAVNDLCNLIRNNLTETRTIEILPNQVVAFSFFNFLDDNNDGEFVIIAGMDEISRLGEIQSWNGLQFLTKWEGPSSTCNEIRGRGGVIFPPFNDDEANFDIFNTDICRVVNLEYSTTTEFKGISGFRFTLREDTLLNSNSPEHACFCINATKNLQGVAECFPEGFADMSSCIGIPIVISLPHLLWANEEYSSTVTGLSPSVNAHTTFADIEPDTGTPLATARRVQYNMIIRNISGIDITNNIQPAVLPILWFEEGMELSQELVNKLNDEYFNMVIAFQAVTWVLVAVGAVTTLICLICCIVRRNRK